MTSRYVAFCRSICCGCGKRVRGCHCVLTAAHSGVAPLPAAARFTSAPRPIRNIAISNSPLITDISSGLVMSPEPA